MEHLRLKVAREPLNKGANQNLSYRACMALFREACLINPCGLDLFSVSNFKQRLSCLMHYIAKDSF